MNFQFTIRQADQTIHGCARGNPEELRRFLESIGLKGVEIRDSLRSHLRLRLSQASKTAALNDVSLALRQMALAVNSGLQLGQAVELVRRGDWTPGVEGALELLQAGIHGGRTLSEMMGLLPRYFPSTVVSLVRAGELSGGLHKSLDDASRLLEQQIDTQKRVSSALVYPGFVTLTFLCLLAVMVLWIVPIFVEVFESLQVEVPFFIKASGLLRSGFSDPWGLLLILQSAAVIIYGVRRWAATPDGQRWLGEATLNIPVVSKLLITSDVLTFVACLRSQIRAGIALVPALKMSALSTQNSRIRKELLGTIKDIVNGQSLAASLRELDWAPPNLAAMIEAGEESGRLEKALSSLETFFRTELEFMIASALALFEPVLIAVMGILVGAFLLGMISPLLTLFQTLGAS